MTDDIENPTTLEPSDESGTPVFRVSGHTLPIALANSIADVLYQQDYLVLQAIGAGAIYRTAMALAIARVLLADFGADLWFVPSFSKFEIDGSELSGLLFEVEYRPQDQ